MVFIMPEIKKNKLSKLSKRPAGILASKRLKREPMTRFKFITLVLQGTILTLIFTLIFTVYATVIFFGSI